MTSADPTPTIAALGIQPTYSAREAAAILGRSYSWLDQRLRKGQFTLPDGTVLEPLRTAGGTDGSRRRCSGTSPQAATDSTGSRWRRSSSLSSNWQPRQGRLRDAALSGLAGCPWPGAAFPEAKPVARQGRINKRRSMRRQIRSTLYSDPGTSAVLSCTWSPTSANYQGAQRLVAEGSRCSHRLRERVHLRDDIRRGAPQARHRAIAAASPAQLPHGQFDVPPRGL
jgi:hypothetical protein